MKLTDIFVRRPVLAIVVNLVIIIAGIQAIKSLTVRQYPRLERATVVVETAYIGADADLVRGFITTPLERVIAGADGIDYIESDSRQGFSSIRVILRLNYEPTRALADISAKVNQVRGDLPPEAEIPVIRIEPADAQIASMYLSFASDILAPNQVNDYLLRVVQPRLSAIEGVQRADILGGQTFAIRAWLKPERLAAYNVSPSQVRAAMAANNFLAAVGSTRGALTQYNLTTNTDLRTLEEFQKLPILEANGGVIRLADIADVELGAESYESEVRFSGNEAVFMGVWVMPTANTLDVIREVRNQLAIIKSELPEGMVGEIAYDSTDYIENAIREVRKTLMETVAIVAVVIFLFLGSIRTALAPLIAIPVSLIGAVFLMQTFGFTLNLLTLLAIVLAVGLVVDDAIVVVENIERHMRDGRSPFDAAILGARELIGPVIAMTITLAAVYTPIGFQGGLTGALFREFAFTLAGAVLISGFVAITLSPMLASKFIHEGDDERGFAGFVTHRFDWLREKYARLLDVTLANRGVVYAVWVALGGFSVLMYQNSPSELAPKEDQSVVFGIISAPANSTLEQTTFYMEEAGKILRSVPEFGHSFQIAQPGFGFGGMLTVPWSERDRTIFQIQKELTARMSALTGVDHPLFVPEALPSAGLFPIEVLIAGTQTHPELLELAQQIVAKSMASGQFGFLTTDVKIDQGQTRIELDREKITSLGLDLRTVGADLAALLSGSFVNRFTLEGRSYKVIPQIERAARLTPELLQQIHVAGPNGTLIPLENIATLSDSVEPRTLPRFSQLNSVKISGVYTQSFGNALAAFDKAASEVLPPGVKVDYAGQSRQFKEESGKFLPAFGLAVVLIYLVLAAQFNSFRDPAVILLGSVPLAMFGALIFTVLKASGPPSWNYSLTEGWTTTMNIYSQVGLVTLVGLIAKHGILLTEFANQLQRQGLSKQAAIRESARLRLRPILMTTAATVFGHIMLIFVSGAGAAARNSIGLVLVCGMTIGTIFTLLILPSIYMLIAKEHKAEQAVTV